MCQKAYCEKCGEEVTYILKEDTFKGTVRGLKFDFIGVVPHCPKCEAELPIDGIEEIEEENIERMYIRYSDITSIK